MNLALATWVSAINFWAWNMIGPLSTTYAGDMKLSSTEASMLVATPILVGSLGRIVVGSLTDRFGGRAMFIAVSLASIGPVLAVGAAGSARSYPLLLVFGFFLGVAGTIFAVGIPFANNWYEAARRGFATGVFGMGMVGTALSAFFTPRFVRWFGLFATHVIVAVALAVTAVVLHRGDAQRTRLHREHRSGAAQAEGRREAARDVGDVVPVRGGVRRVCCVRQLSAHLHQDDLRLLAGRRRRPHRRRSRWPRCSPDRSAGRCPTASRRSSWCWRRSRAPR